MPVHTISIPSTCDGTLQRIQYSEAPGKARPLLAALHTWSYDYTQDASVEYFRRCEERGWHCIFPDFRGPNRTSSACGSDSAVQDLRDAAYWAMERFSIDHRRVFLVGVSGGGYMALLAAGKMPSLWTAVSAWAPIFDLARWHRECVIRKLEYSLDLEAVCGGAPGDSPEIDAQYRARSPLDSFWRANIVPVDINVGIHDGHGGAFGGAGSVPVGHGVRAFNELVKASGKPGDIISEEAIDYIERNRKTPEGLARLILTDAAYDRDIHLRRMNSLARLTLFEGGHEILYDAAFSWFEEF